MKAIFKKIDPDMIVLKAEKNTVEVTEDFDVVDGMEETKKEIGTVVQVGDNVTRIEVGDRVIFKAYNSDTVKFQENEYEFVLQRYVLAAV